MRAIQKGIYSNEQSKNNTLVQNSSLYPSARNFVPDRLPVRSL